MGFSLSTIFDSFIQFIAKSYNKLDAFFAKRNEKMLWAFVIMLCFGIILFLNVLTPMIADDFGYLYIFGEKEQVGSLSELIHSQVSHYHLWGGRSVVHFIAQGLLQMPRYVVDVLNSIVYLLFVSLIYLHVRGCRGKHSISLFVLINLAVWFIIPMFGDTILWVTGSANYLWGMTIILLFLLPYRFYDGRQMSIVKQIMLSLPMLLLGVIAGWTNENTVAGMIVIILLLFLYYRAQKWKLPMLHVVGFVGVVIGYYLMISAPGNFTRTGGATEISLFIVLFRIFAHTQTLFLDYGLLIAFYMIIILLYKKLGSARESTPIHLSLIYTIGALAGIYAMIFSPQFPTRAWFGVVTFFIISLGIVIYHLDYREQLLKQMRASLIFIGCITFFFSFYLATKDIYRIYQIDKEREILAREARERGDEKCYFKMFESQTEYVHSEDKETNFLLSYYYGIFIEYEKE